IFKETKFNKFGIEDPYYETYTIEDPKGKKAPVVKRRKRPIPVGISEKDAKILKKLKRRAYRLDLLFSCCGFRVGWSCIIGFVPIIGDIFNVVLSLMLYRTALNLENGLPKRVQVRFLLNIVIDFAIGLVPIVGDFIDIAFKANSRNALLVEKHLAEIGQKRLK
ncbi:DUF4112 domain-containing protein ASCRUDRAFT_19343, partial [Ascoidea rubescens DSM 1968]